MKRYTTLPNHITEAAVAPCFQKGSGLSYLSSKDPNRLVDSVGWLSFSLTRAPLPWLQAQLEELVMAYLAYVTLKDESPRIPVDLKLSSTKAKSKLKKKKKHSQKEKVKDDL